MSTKITDFNLILDLDETLIRTDPEIENLNKLGILTNPQLTDLRLRTYKIRLDDVDTKDGTGNTIYLWGLERPHLLEFLSFACDYFDNIIVWSAGIPKYVTAIVKIIFRHFHGPNMVFNRNDCENIFGNAEKPIIKALNEMTSSSSLNNLIPSKTLILDDKDTTFKSNPENGILIPPYQPDISIESFRKDDDCLLRLISWLKRSDIINCDDVRKLDKTKIF